MKHLSLFFIIVFANSLYAQKTPLFERVTPKQSGVAFKNVITESQQFNALTYENIYNGGGVAIGDINNDGLDDIYLVSNSRENKLYLNLGDFRFKDITSTSGVSCGKGWKTGTSMVDINGDGLLDIYVCKSGKENLEERRNSFFINKGNLTFEDKAKEMNLDDPSYSTQAAFLDYDKDGDLDVFLLATNVNVIRDLEFKGARNTVHPYAGDKLFRNDEGIFTEVTSQAGILSNALGFGLGVGVSDFNKDGWPDLYVSNDYIEPDYLYINNGDGTFSNKLSDYLRHISHFSMGLDVSDINNDSWPDIYTADMLPEDNYRQKLLYGPDNYEHYQLSVKEGFHHQYMRNMLHVSNGNGTFSEIGQFSGVSNTDWSWAPLFADYDNDGFKDLCVTNGYFRDYTQRDFLKFKGDYYFKKAIEGQKPDTLELAAMMSSTPVHNYIFRNNGDLTFSDKSSEWGFDKLTFSNGAAYGDLDNDGDIDLVINNQNDHASLFRNRTNDLNLTSSSFLRIKLNGTGLNTFGLGSKIYVYAGSRMQYYEQSPARGYQSSVSPTLQIGLGDVTKIDSVRVEWLLGKVTLIKDVTANQEISMNESDAVPRQVRAEVPDPFFAPTKSLITFSHRQPPVNDFKRQPLLSIMHSNCGPAMATADVDGDGLSDIFITGSEISPGKLFIQKNDGQFVESTGLTRQGNLCAETDAVFFDADNDGDQDLYVACGGFHYYTPNDPAFKDWLYMNDGRGNFTLIQGALPELLESKSCVRVTDFDLDGDVDIFVGGRVVPGRYPEAPESYLLINENAKFRNVAETWAPTLRNAGMITDAIWVDVNKDTYPDLITAGEFMPIQVYLNKSGKVLEEDTTAFSAGRLHGLWSRLAAGDFDHDGDLDLIAGNHGLNSQFKASGTEMLELTYADFDKNGSVDPVLTGFIQHKSYPFAGRDEMLDQVYALRKKFTSYAAYANAQLTTLFPQKDLQYAKHLRVNELKTIFIENKDGRFVNHELPNEAQFAPVRAIEVFDFDDDGNLDFILAGNEHAIRIRLGAIDANYGQLFLGNGKNGFRYIPQKNSGLAFTGDVKSLRVVNVNGRQYLLAGINNEKVATYIKNNRK